jgi:chromosome partitioning protein
MSGKIISIVNFKGGVGKTTLAVNVSACLAEQNKDKKVALIDLDPQSNSSIWMLKADRWTDFNRPEQIRNTAVSMFIGTVTKEAFLIPYTHQKSGEYLPNLFLLPASYPMIGLERKIIDRMANRRLKGNYSPGDEYLFLHDDAKVLREWFDYVFIDCPPNLYFGTLNAICHSDYILIPCVPDTLSTSGFNMLVDEIEKTIAVIVKRAKNYKPPKVLGVAITRLKTGTNEHNKGIDVIRARVEEFQKQNHLLINGKTKVFSEHPIREYMVHSEAVQDNLPLCFCAPKMSAYTDISNFTGELISAMEAQA